MCKTRDHMDFSQGLLDSIEAQRNCISKSRCLHMFYKDRYCYKFCKIHRKTPVSEFLRNKVAGLQPAIYIKKETSAQVFTCEFCEIFQKIYPWRKFGSNCFWKCFFYIALLDGCFYIFENLTHALKIFLNLLNLQLR